MNDRTKKVLKAAGITAGAAAAAVVSAYVSTKYMMDIALDRQEPKALKVADRFIAGTQGDNAFLKKLEEDSQRLARRENEVIRLTSHDGIELVGHLIEAPYPKRVVLAFHGWRSSWHRDFGMIADFLYNNDCTVLYAEQRGQNESGGEYMGFGLTERYDCRDWANWAAERFGPEMPLYLTGVSMGATTVLMAAGLDLPASVRGIAADCGFTSPQAIWKHVAEDNLHLNFRLRSAIADAIYKQRLMVGSGSCSTLDALRITKIPIMLVHGADDHFVPVKMTYENYIACAAPKKLLIVPGADHGMSYFVEPARYEASVRSFWKQYDGYKPAKA